MISLGIEGSAHTLGIGIIDSKGNVLADLKRTYAPKDGGIHPREAARFMADNFGSALREAIDVAGIKKEDIDLVSFSKGPGLGPCLSNVAIGARALSLHLNKPIMGVNHCVAHIEIGNLMARKEFPNWVQPLVLYVSGANSQILMFKENRYRIFGETLDVGLGNMLDKFGRKAGIPHPAGPKIETLAREGKNYIELPYVVKGNDLSFSGIFTESLKKTKDNSLEDVCYSLQETSFAMATEATERALCHLKSRALLFTGGVSNNKRFQGMLKEMADENGVLFSVPKGYCGDNGAMIAWTGLVMHEAGIRHGLEDTGVDQDFRTDQVDITWVKTEEKLDNLPKGVWKGAEATLTRDGDKIIKKRLKKKYRLAELDKSIRKSRTAKEARLLSSARTIGVLTPEVYETKKEDYSIVMQFIDGEVVSETIDSNPALAREIGKKVRLLHDKNIVHGDLTTSNMMISNDELIFIDFGLGDKSRKVEDKATDLLLLKKALNANHSKNFEKLWAAVLDGYGDSNILKRLSIAEKRGRYL